LYCFKRGAGRSFDAFRHK